MLQTSDTNPVIGKNPCVDRQVSIRNLGFEKDIGSMQFQTRPDGDIDRSIPVCVPFVSTSGAMEVSPVTDTHISTSRTLLRSISGIHRFNQYPILPRNTFECHSEGCIGHSFGFSVRFSVPFRSVEMFQIFNTYESVIIFSEIDNLMSDLVTMGSNIVSLVSFQFPQFLNGVLAPFVSIGIESAPSDRNVSLSIPNILSEIELFENLPISVDYGYGGQSFDTHIHPNNSIITFSYYDLSLESNIDTLTIKSKEGGAISLFYEGLKSSVCTIHSNGYGDSFPHASERDDGIFTPCNTEFSASWNIKWDTDISNLTTVSEDGNGIFEQIDSNLGMKAVFLPDIIIEESMKTETSVLLTAFGNDIFKGVSICSNQAVDEKLLGFRWLDDVQGNGFLQLHTTINQYNFIPYKHYASSIPPTTEVVGFLDGEEK